MNWERIKEIIRKELRVTFRDPRMRGMVLVPPIVQFMVFGFIVNLDVDRSRLAWLDQDNSPQSRELRDAFTSSKYFTVTHSPANPKQMQDLLDRDEIHSAIAIPPGFGEDLARGRQTRIQVLVEGSNSNTASILANYAAEIGRTFANGQIVHLVTQKRMARGGAIARVNAPGIDFQQRVWFNPELKSRNYFIPGVAVNIITIVTLMLTSMAIVREKEIGTMEQLMVTPIRPMELMLGKTLPFAIVGLFDLGVIIVLGMTVFHIPFQGNVLLLFCAAVLFMMTTLGAGIFISTVSNTQMQASLSTFFFFQPAFMLSGFAFPIRSMPEPVQYLTMINPIRYFIEICRGVFLKGSGIDVLWPQFVALAIFGVAILSLSALRFHKRLD
ncbi:MAG: ABC transporter permease [Candidatus Solibacter usitatus]|nr:ABC transporter permease [Candidatus Solibacter usitatus]